MEIAEIARNHELLFRFTGMGLSAVYFGGLAVFLRRNEHARRMVQLLSMIGVVAMVSYFWWLNALQ